ncbi:hypothetical protein G7081_04055 [Vagococcus coleopterorum]|uniref:Uncharacterized protein n=1 Tax=Vagococcus coleopterorum TaxID=2714946 RepID=A0A6G8AMV1_9ENTE|nr:YrvL family regulatory protein [Vagococcus coleopterorum]QIL46300.1 hypothetical protein G7081_04055 [Vagococcus coleopterorum]
MLGVESTSKGMLILFLMVAIIIGLVLEPVVTGICKGLARAINIPLKTAFVGYLILGFIVDILIFIGVDYLFTSVWLPTSAIVIFSMLGTLLEIILERTEKEWQ